MINHAESPQRHSLRVDERHTGVESNEWAAGHEWVISKSFVYMRIPDLKDVYFMDRMSTERDIAGSLRSLKTMFGLEPLTIPVHETHERNGSAANRGRELREIVVGEFRCSIQHFVV